MSSRRDAVNLPDLPAEIAAEARRAADARRTVSLALAPSISDEDFGAYRAKVLAEVDSAAIDCARAAQRARAEARMLERSLFEMMQRPPVQSGASSWRPSHSLVCVRGGK